MTLGKRLALLVAGLTTALLLGLGWYVERTLERVSVEVLDEELAAQAAAVIDEVEVKRSGALEIDHADELAPGHAVEILTHDGRVLFSTGPPWPDAPRPVEGYARGADASGRPHRILVREFRPDHAERLSGGDRLLLRIAAPANRFAPLLARFRDGLMIALVLGVLGGGAAAMALARASLRPLRRLTAEIGGVDAAALDRPVAVDPLPPDLRPLATTFNTVMARLAAAFAQQRAFVARASHALRTPTTGILARAEVAVRRPRTEAEYRDALTEIAELARDSAAKITAMLALMRADERRPLRIQSLPVAEVGADVVRMLAPAAAQGSLRLTSEVPPELTVDADRDALQELLEALLDNAIRYTPAGGEVGLTARARAGATELEVWDTGRGIAPTEREQVFDRFFRGSAADAAAIPGSGLGLAICRSIADAHGATLELAERSGGGTRAVVRFPAHG